MPSSPHSGVCSWSSGGPPLWPAGAGFAGLASPVGEPDVDLRHWELAPGKGNDVDAGRIGFVGKRYFGRRTESEAVAGAEFVTFTAIDEDERARQHPEHLADVCVG